MSSMHTDDDGYYDIEAEVAATKRCWLKFSIMMAVVLVAVFVGLAFAAGKF